MPIQSRQTLKPASSADALASIRDTEDASMTHAARGKESPDKSHQDFNSF